MGQGGKRGQKQGGNIYLKVNYLHLCFNGIDLITIFKLSFLAI